MEKRWLLVQQARKNMPNDTEAFAHRVAQLRPRIEALGTRLAAAGRAQGEYLAGIAVDELEAQKQRLTSYQVQARFALASIYDRSADASGSVLEVIDIRPPQSAHCGSIAAASVHSVTTLMPSTFWKPRGSLLPRPSVRWPSSSTWRNVRRTSRWAFSISSRSTTW